MSVAYYIVLQSEIDGFDPFVNGKAIAHANEKELDKLFKALNVTPLAAFLSQDPDELAEFIADQGVDAPEDLPSEQWFTAEQGLATVRALKHHLVSNPKALKNATAIGEDLAEYEAVLDRIKKEGVLWHLALDF
jgi:hypothetical protein